MTPNNFRVKNGLTVSNGVTVSAGNVVITSGQLVIGATAINATSISGSATAAYTNAVSYTDTKIGTANTAMAANAATAYTNAIAIAANATNLTSGTVPFARLPNLFLGTTAIQSTSAAQAVSGITTLAAGNTTITGFANVTSTIQGGSSLTIAGAASGITTLAAGNTTITGFTNVTSTLQVGGISTFSGNVVLGSVGLSSNGSFGTAGHVLHSNGTATYWAADDNSGGTVTSIATANGLSGGTITTTGTLGVTTGSTLTVNTTGIHVNSALSIASLALSGDLTVTGNLTVSGTRTYVNTTTLDIGDNIFTLNADLGAVAPSENAGIEIMRGTSANVQFIWDETNDRWSTNAQPLAVSSLIPSSNIVLGSAGLSSNGSLGTAGHVLHSNGTATYWAADDGSVTSIATANGLTGGTITTTGTLGVATGSTLTVNTTGIHVNSTLQLSTLELSGGSGSFAFANATSNWIQWNTAGVAAPTLTTRSSGTKMVLYPLVSGGSVDYGLGVEGNHIWFSVPTPGTDGFKWYAGTTNIMTANATGLNLNTRALSGVTTAAMGNTTITGFANVTSTIQGGSSLTIAGALSGVTTAAMGNTTITGFANVSSTITSVSGLVYANNLLLQGDGTATYIRAINSGGHLYLGANNQNLNMVAANGNFGVGTLSPGVKLDVTGSARVSESVTIGTGGTYAAGTIYSNADWGMIFRAKQASPTTAEFLWTNAGDTQRMRIDTNGNLGLGVAPSGSYGKLTVAGGIRTTDDSSSKLDLGRFSAGAPNSYIKLGTNSNSLRISNAGDTVDLVTLTNAGDFGIGTTTPGYKLEVVGSFAATTKSFVIPHPTKPGMKLRYGSLEGPENGVYVRGRLRAGQKIIQLPDYWEGLVDQDTYTVNLTPVGKHQELYVEHIADDYIIVGGGDIDCFYTVFAERNDVEKLEVEF